MQFLLYSKICTVAYFVHFVSVPQVQAAHVAEAGYTTGLQSLQGTAMVHHVNKHACNSLRRTFEIVPVCPTGHDNEKLCTFKYMNMYKNSLEFWKLCHFVFVSLVQCQPKQEETASKSLPSGLQYKSQAIKQVYFTRVKIS